MNNGKPLATILGRTRPLDPAPVPGDTPMPQNEYITGVIVKPIYRVVRFVNDHEPWYAAFGKGWATDEWTPITDSNLRVISEGGSYQLIHLHMRSIGYEEDTTENHYHGGWYKPSECGLSI